MITSDPQANPLEGLRFLIIEDEAVQALATCDSIARLGGQIANVIRTYDHARIIAEDTDFDCAILDANLHGILSFPVASILKRRGKPFIYLTAYKNAVLECMATDEAPVLSKPCSQAALQKALTDLVCSPSQASTSQP